MNRRIAKDKNWKYCGEVFYLNQIRIELYSIDRRSFGAAAIAGGVIVKREAANINDVQAAIKVRIDSILLGK